MHNILWGAVAILTIAVVFFAVGTFAQRTALINIGERFNAAEAREAEALDVIENLLAFEESYREGLVDGYERCAGGWLTFNSTYGPIEGQAVYCYTAQEVDFGESTERTEPANTDRGGTGLRGETPSGAPSLLDEGLR